MTSLTISYGVFCLRSWKILRLTINPVIICWGRVLNIRIRTQFDGSGTFQLSFDWARLTFVNHASEDIGLPDPKFLAIHAAIAQILRATGVGEYLDKVMSHFVTDGSVISLYKLTPDDLELRIMLSGLPIGNPRQF